MNVLDGDKPKFRNRKGEVTTNVLVVCSQDLQFIYVLVGWEGSAADSRVLRDAISHPNGLKVPQGTLQVIKQLLKVYLILFCIITKWLN